MSKDLFDFDHSRNWPDQWSYPLNEETTGFNVLQVLKKDLKSSSEFLIITGFTSLSNLISFFGTDEYNNLRNIRVVIGYEPDERVSKRFSHYSLPTEIKNYWLKQNISIKQCGPILNVIEKIKKGDIHFKVIDKLHAKIYVGDNTAMLGSSNFSIAGLSKHREANIRLLRTDSKTANDQFVAIRQIANNYFELADEYNDHLVQLLQKLLKDANWEEALARALAEILESKWMQDYPALYQAVISKELWPSQRIGIARAMKIIQDQGNLLLADPTGSGKTRFATALAYTVFHWLAENGFREHSNAFIVSPKQVVENWKKEEGHFKLFNRIESMGKLSFNDEKDRSALRKEMDAASILIIDEAHNYLNRGTKRSKAIMPRCSTHVILSTATPINKRAEDLLRLIELLDIDNLSDNDLQTYLELRKNKFKKPDPNLVGKLKGYINQFIVRRTKQELNRMIEREPHEYKNSNGHNCRFPKTIAEIYATNETSEDKAIALKINELVQELKGVNYLQKFMFPEHITTEDDKRQYLINRFRAAPALAGFEVKSSLRSSRCALYEYLYGTDAALNEFAFHSSKAKTGNIVEKLKKYSNTQPVIKFPMDWLPEESKWILDFDKYQAVCKTEIALYNEIGKLTLQLSNSREQAKIHLLLSNVESFGKILGFDSTILTLDYLKNELQKIDGRIPVIVATGASESNKKQVRDFFDVANVESSEKLIALCSDAMAESINLPAAKSLVLLDMPSVLRIIEQRIGRLERMDSEHKEIYVYWPEDAEEFSLKGDKRMIEILAMTETLIGNNVEIPPKGLFEKYYKDGLETRKYITAYENYKETDEEWDGVKDSTESLYSLMEGDEALITHELYNEFKDVESTVKTAISFIETDKSWSFFSFRGDAKRSPKWLLIDESGRPFSDFSLISNKLKEYLKDKKIVQKRWNDINTPEEINRIIHKLRKMERELLPWKKKRALTVAEKLLKEYLEKNLQNATNRNETNLKLLSFFKGVQTPDFLENAIDYNHFADLWLEILLPALDKKRESQLKKRKIITMRDLTLRDVQFENATLRKIYDNCQHSNSLDELIASCIIAIKK